MSPALLLAIASLTAGPTRSFHLGFTPFPYDLSLEAVDFAYASVAKDADMILFHLDQGIPWSEALRDAPFPKKVSADWTDWIRRVPKGHKIYLAVTPLNTGRDGLATDLSDIKDAGWMKRGFDDADVQKAYLNYCHRAISAFHPDYLAIGVESNLVAAKAPDKWAGYLRLHRFIYKTLKKEHPDLPIFDTVVGTALLPGYAPEYDHNSQMKALDELMSASDVFAVSIYPYMSTYRAESIPDEMFGDLEKLAHGKPMAIAESGYPAKRFSIMDGKLEFNGTEEKQTNWVRRVLDAAGKGKYLFVVNYITRDYEALWEKLGRTDLNAIWKNTGFYDADGMPRRSLAVWRGALARPYKR